MSEIVVVQVGQCGNQIGWQFWGKAIKEHQKYCKQDITTEGDNSYKSFFDVGPKGSFETLKDVRARALLIDSEDRVTERFTNSSFSSIFEGLNLGVDNGGAANKWPSGYYMHASQYGEPVMEHIRKLAEKCDHLESFFMLYSLGGGTGSGFGSYILEHLADYYPHVWKMATVVTPTDDTSDVMTTPYNAALATQHLCNYANCVFPVENSALQRFVPSDLQELSKTSKEKKVDAFSTMNSVVANFLLDLTAGSRFSGSMNVDLREIETNMIPFPNHKFIIPGYSPIFQENNSKAPRDVKSYFSEATSNAGALCCVDVEHGISLAAALLVRGIPLPPVRNAVDNLGRKIMSPSWNTDSWKIGLCSFPPLFSKMSVLALENSSSTAKIFQTIQNRFNKLFKKRAWLQSYITIGEMSIEQFETADESLSFLLDEYNSIDQEIPYAPRPRLRV